MSKKRFVNKKSSEMPSDLPSDLPDRRAMDKMMADLGRLLEEQEFESIDDANAFLGQLMAAGQPIPSAAPRTPLEEAQQRMYEAWEASGKRRIKLAKEALKISPDCADAYVLLAEESARSIEEACELYAAGVAAGQRALGDELFEEGVGHFWGMVETRPYMRARAGLGSCLWLLDRRAEAIQHFEDMLRLNPGDNQGLRYFLLTWYIVEGLAGKTEHLLAEYEDDAAAAWQYNRALFYFRQKQGSKQARAALRKALEFNPHVPKYLLNPRLLPDEPPAYVGFGDVNEAVSYVFESGLLWLEDEEALAWLERIAAEN